MSGTPRENADEIMRSLGRLEQAAEDTRQDLKEIKLAVKVTETRLGKVETGQARLKAMAGLLMAAVTGGAGWLGFK